MILLLTILSIAIFILSLIFYRSSNFEDWSVPVMVISIMVLIVCLIAGIILGISITETAHVDEKIAMYEEENNKIETQLAETVKQYMEYEKETLSEFKTESAISYVSLYPELKSDTLVTKQCETYIANNEKIKELKEDKINAKAYKWWLYFGE